MEQCNAIERDCGCHCICRHCQSYCHIYDCYYCRCLPIHVHFSFACMYLFVGSRLICLCRFSEKISMYTANRHIIASAAVAAAAVHCSVFNKPPVGTNIANIFPLCVRNALSFPFTIRFFFSLFFGQVYLSAMCM